MIKSTFILWLFLFSSVTVSKADNSFMNDSLLLALQNDSIAEYYKTTELLDSAILYKNKAAIIYSHIYNESDTLYTDCLYELACLNYDAQHFKSAIRLFEKIEKLQEKYNMYDVQGHSLIIAHLSLSYAHMEYYPQAIKTCNLLLELKKKNESSVFFSYEEIFEYLSNYYSADGNIYMALDCSLKAYDIIIKNPTTDDGLKISVIGDIAGCYYHLNDVETAIKYQKEAIACSTEFCKKNKEGHELLVRSLYDLSKMYYGIFNYQEATRIIINCLNYYKDNGIKKDLTYAQVLLLYANINHDTEYYDFAKQLCKESYETHRNVLGDNNELTLHTQLVLSDYYAITGSVNDAITIGEDAVQRYKEIYDGNSNHYAEALEVLSDMYANIGYTKDAIDRLSNCLEIYESNSLVNSDIQFKLSRLYASTHKFNEAITLCEKAIENPKNGKVEKYLLHANLAYYFYMLSNMESAKKHILEYLSGMEESFYNRFVELPYASKKDFWDYYGGMMRDLLPLMAYKTQDQDLINLVLDNSSLWSKGLLYRTDKAFRQYVYGTHNQIFINKYLEMNSNKYELFRILATSVHQERKDSLINAIQEQEMQLIKELNFTQQHRITWRDIQEKLSPDEIAIEFVSYHVGECTQYLALTIKKDYDNPKCHGMFIDNGKEDLKRKCDSIWIYLKDDLDGIKQIYFSPTGIINNVGIEYSYLDSIYRVSDKYDVYRLSSTGALVNREDKQKRDVAILYGDLQYDFDCHTVSNDSFQYTSTNRSLRDAIIARHGFEPLLNTIDEIDGISQTLHNKQLEIKKYTREAGTEESFRMLSGKNINIIHLATHGMYIGKEIIDKGKYINNLSFVQNNDIHYTSFVEDQQMTRSFLVMSGGNMLLQRKSIGEGKDDGILTAEEISLLDFQNLDIVTLSACQTALGDITHDGVMGLQRGFKKAGAKTILMSLDKVDDEATRILMVEFYRNLMNGKRKLQSLKNAQKHLRSVENGKYDDPKYWASFIMLDGLN